MRQSGDWRSREILTSRSARVHEQSRRGRSRQAAKRVCSSDGRGVAAPAGRALRFETAGPFDFVYRLDAGAETTLEAQPTQFGMSGVTLTPEILGSAKSVSFRLSPKDGEAIAGEVAIGG